MLINGKSTLFKGVDRHDNSPLNGRTVSKEEMEKDVQLMKSLNINAVRTSHYPNNPYFYDLCDKYGIYVMAEANVECHGLMELSSEPSWKKSFTERNENQVKRYKNHASIVMWSMGNESETESTSSRLYQQSRHWTTPVLRTMKETVFLRRNQYDVL